jgi:aminoglycoside/choline kinase family phosphotransferase
VNAVNLTGVEPLERVRRLLAGISELEGAGIERLVGDASNRAYFRIALGNDESRIVALLPEAFETASLPFLNVARLLGEIPVRIPEVIHVAGEQGALVLEDLGDDILQDVVEGETLERKTALYQEAIDIAARLVLRGAELASERFVPYQIAFDPKKFMWELDFFRKHFLEGLRGCVLEASEREGLDAAFQSLSAELCAHTFVLCHRDYHARNLMVVPGAFGRLGQLAVIDFQDARQGPRAYDLVSLLNDSYVAHTPEFVGEMTERFERAVGVDVSEEYDPAALQRNLKALGTFGYQIGHRDNDVYERYLEGTLELVRANLERNPQWDSLRRILARHCEEIA